MAKLLFEMKHITKSFPGVKALEDVSFRVGYGEVHALVGENGAGKSTLMKILNGIYSADQGEMIFEGAHVKPDGHLDAKKLGISTIFQEFNLVESLSVAENIFLGELNQGKAVINWKELRRRAQDLVDKLQFDLDVKKRIEELDIAKMQMVEIAKALSNESKLIIMDEPSATLTSKELERLFEIIEDLRKSGISIVYISHRLDEIFRACSNATILRDGHVIDTLPLSSTTKVEIIEKMVGRKIQNEFPPREDTIDKNSCLLQVEGLRNIKVENAEIKVKKGEVLGIFGIVGAGRTELARAIFGADHIDAGTIYINGKLLRKHTPGNAKKLGLGYLSENRKEEGLIVERNVSENVTITNLPHLKGRLLLNNKKEKKITQKYIDELAIRTSSIKQTVVNLSGGNQQKIVIAKWLFSKTDILILDEPTRGIDVGAKFEVYKLINQLTKEGKAILFISSELPEVLNMSDRIIVMNTGRIAADLTRDEATPEKVMHYAVSKW